MTLYYLFQKTIIQSCKFHDLSYNIPIYPGVPTLPHTDWPSGMWTVKPRSDVYDLNKNKTKWIKINISIDDVILWTVRDN